MLDQFDHCHLSIHEYHRPCGQSYCGKWKMSDETIGETIWVLCRYDRRGYTVPERTIHPKTYYRTKHCCHSAVEIILPFFIHSLPLQNRDPRFKERSSVDGSGSGVYNGIPLRKPFDALCWKGKQDTLRMGGDICAQ